MAIDLRQLKEKHSALDEAPINDIESAYIIDVEKHIDEQITLKYNSDNRRINIDMRIVNFNYNPIKKTSFTGLTTRRRQVLKKHLLDNYEKTGWSFSEYTDEYDGPNRGGDDYFVFVGL